MTAKADSSPLTTPAALAEVQLVDARVSAATGGMKETWWYAEVKAGRAPQPVVRRHRCTRWRLQDVRDFWHRFAEGDSNTANADALMERVRKASAAGAARRQQQGGRADGRAQ